MTEREEVKPHVRVVLDVDDLNFIRESIHQNIPCDEYMAEMEKETLSKINRALSRVLRMEQEG